MATNALRSTQFSKRTGSRYAVALLATVVALLVRRGLNPVLGDYVPYITLFPVVAFCAWYCGVGPSVLSVVLDLIGEQYWFTRSGHWLLRQHGRGHWHFGLRDRVQSPDSDGRSPPQT